MKRSALVLLATAVAMLLAWQIGVFGGEPPVASGATGACDPALSRLVSTRLSVPAGTAATLTVTCRSAAGPIPGRTIVLKQMGGRSAISPSAAVTNAHGVATFRVIDRSVAGPITYTAVDAATDVSFDEIVQVRFVARATNVVPVETVGLIGLAGMAAVALALLQLRRRRRSAAGADARHAS